MFGPSYFGASYWGVTYWAPGTITTVIGGIGDRIGIGKVIDLHDRLAFTNVNRRISARSARYKRKFTPRNR